MVTWISEDFMVIYGTMPSTWIAGSVGNAYIVAEMDAEMDMMRLTIHDPPPLYGFCQSPEDPPEKCIIYLLHGENKLWLPTGIQGSPEFLDGYSSPFKLPHPPKDVSRLHQFDAPYH